MKRPLRRSLLLHSIVLVLTLSLILAFACFQIYRTDMVARYQHYAADAVELLARRVDGDDLEACIASGRKSEQYEQLQRLANDIKETHDLAYLYIVKPLKIDPPENMMDVLSAVTEWEAINEADELTDLGVITDYAYPAETAAEYMARMTTDPTVTFFRNDTDFGDIYTAIRPLFNSRGEPIAVLCGDIEIGDIYRAAHRYALAAGLTALAFSVVALLVLNLWYDRRIVRPIGKLQTAAERFEDKCRRRASLEELTIDDPGIHTGDEIEALGGSVISMVSDVQNYAGALLEKEREILSMKEHVNRMDVLAYRDTLTGAGNKAAYDKTASRLERDIRAGGARFALVMADLNNLKEINDTYGHDKGDVYIIRMYTVLKTVFRKSPIFRIGGDEFVAVAEGEELARCGELVEQARARMRRTAADKKAAPWERVSVALGYAVYADGEDADAVLRRADRNMYEEKKQMHEQERLLRTVQH